MEPFSFASSEAVEIPVNIRMSVSRRKTLYPLANTVIESA